MNDADSKPRAYNTGLLTSILWIASLALLSGLALAPMYRSSADAAHSSTQAISNSAVLGFARDVHHWSSALLIVLGATYIVVGLFRGAYRKPGQWLWVGAIGIFLVGMLLQLTGHLLPFDVHAVRTAVVETGIAGNAPAIGAVQAKIVRGGDAVGPQTLRLWYLAHISALTVLMLVLIGFTWAQARKLGLNVGRTPWLVVPTSIVLVLAALLNSPLGPAATSYDMSSFEARPEWYVLPLHSLLNLAQDINPSFAFLGSMVVPVLVLLLVLAMPWISASAKPTWGRTMAACTGLALAGLVLMSFQNVAPPVGDQLASTWSGGALNPQTLDPKKVAEGRQLFDIQGCRDCHTLNGRGGKIGPELTLEGTRHADLSWHVQHLKDPRSVNPGSTMPSFRQLDESKLEALAQYLMSLKK